MASAEPLERSGEGLGGSVLLSLPGGYPTGRVGAPQLPAASVALGVPIGAQVSVRATPGPSAALGRLRPAPVPSLDGGKPVYREDPDAYRAAGGSAQRWAEAVSDGLIRDRRVVQIEMRPVRYDPASGSLHQLSSMTVRVDFLGSKSTSSAFSGSGSFAPPVRAESPAFQRYFERHLLNEESSRSWRAPPGGSAGAVGASSESEGEARRFAVKIYLSERGVCRISGAQLQALGVDIEGARPNRLRVEWNGRELPAYVSGAQDGRFDPEDAVDFLVNTPTSPYSPYNVYWLIEGERRGLRPAELEGAPQTALASSAASFRSKIRLEENLLHTRLQESPPAYDPPEDPHLWYENRESWLWFGVENGSIQNKAERLFPLYDAAQSFDFARVDVSLQGGTPFEHDAMAMLNGILIGRSPPGWFEQDRLTMGRSLRMENLTDAADGLNAIEIVRVDGTVHDNVDQYPYHVYVDRVDIEYTRLYRAVSDSLFASSPPSKEPAETRGLRTLEYEVSAFRDPRVSVYEHDGFGLTARLRNVESFSVPLDAEGRARLLAVQAARGESFPLPEATYTARFQMLDDRDWDFIAVSDAGFLRPVRMELDIPSNLKDRTNGADWIIIHHPRYAESAQRLRDWRASARGGGHRAVMVSVTDIYDEFSHGAVTPKAVKAFLKHAYAEWRAPALTHAVILGDGTYDFYGVDRQLYPEAPEFLGYIPTHYVWSIYGETGIDHWYAAVSGIDALPDLFLGRIPVETEEEARAAVEKIIRYEERPPNGAWRRQIVSIADNDTTNSGDFIFRKSLTEISQNHTLLGYVTNKIFLSDIMEELDEDDAARNRRAAEIARERISDALNRGAVISQYAGHGGRLVWAHEIIFDNTGIRNLSETDRLSLMFVLSCNNAYFDAPAEPSMGELLMRMENRGIVGMIAATRYTFGSGNDALAKIIFDDIFKRNARGFGEIAFNPKTQLILERSLGHLEVMQQYLLFGDPASQLHTAKYEAHPLLENRSVPPGGELRILPGAVFEAEYDPQLGEKVYTPVAGFNGRLFATAQFVHRETGSVIEVTAEADAADGAYPALVLPVPLAAQSGRGQVELYIQSSGDLAVGGSGFAVSEPIVERIDLSEADGQVALSLKITDDKAIQRVDLNWQEYEENAVRWRTAPMEADAEKGEGWYRPSAPVAAPPPGRAFRYRVRAVDSDGNETETETLSETFHPIPDWNIAQDAETGEPAIRYGFNSELGWHASVRVENSNAAEPMDALRIDLFAGNPDLDGDLTPDGDANRLGTVMIHPDEWRLNDPLSDAPGGGRLQDPDTPLNLYWTAETALQVRLPMGETHLAVWADPGRETSETYFRDNLSHQRIRVAELRPGSARVTLRALDGVLSAELSQRSLGGVYTARMSEEGASYAPQPSLTALPLVGGGSAARRLSADGLDLEAPLNEPVSIEMEFDIAALREALSAGREEDGLGGVGDLDAALINLLSDAGIYEWRPELERWRKLPGSAFVRNADQTPELRTVLTEPMSPGFSAEGAWAYDPSAAERGRYFAFMTSGSTYDLYRLDAETERLERVQENRAALPPFAPLPDEGDRRYPSLRFGSDGFEYGQVWEANLPLSAPANDTGAAGAYLGNSGGGAVRAAWTDAASAERFEADVWAALFVSRRAFEVRRRSQAGAVGALGTLSDGWTDPSGRLRIEIQSGSKPFEAGDSVRFETRETGVLRGTAERLGAFGAFLSDDKTAPQIRFAVEGQDFADGDPVSPNPAFAAAFSDNSGVDPLDVRLELTRDGRPEPAIEASELRFHAAPGSNQLLVNYAPELEPGDYRLSASAADLDGNEASGEIRFRVTHSAELISVLNYPNPFRSETDIAVEAAGEIERLEVSIYSLQGRVARRLSHPPTAGFARLRWDGRDADGREVANGVYYAVVKMTARGETRSQTIKLLKQK